MKYISFIGLVIVIFLSQFLVRSPEGASFQTHSSIQSELQEFIRTYVQEHLPNAQEFKILSIYSEPAGEKKVKVNFNYSFKVTDAIIGKTKTELEGAALLTEIEDGKWSLDSIQIDGQKLEFDDPVIITPDADSMQNLNNAPETEEEK